jgi:hypothetical protein
MSALYLFIAILIVLAIAIVISIMVWILQAKISSRITLLEQALEKKNIEFDAFKKEKLAGPIAPKESAPAVEMAGPIDMPLSQQTVEEGSIQIVRNVRGTFQPTDTPMHTHTTPLTADSPLESDSGAERASPTQQRETPPMMPMSGGGAIEDTKRWPHTDRQKNSFENGPRPVAPPRPSLPPSTPAPAGALPLFSPALQRADFNALYAALVKVLQTRPDRILFINCDGVQTLGAPEIDYLEKIAASLQGQNRSLSFVQCNPVLAAQLRQRPSLAASVK